MSSRYRVKGRSYAVRRRRVGSRGPRPRAVNSATLARCHPFWDALPVMPWLTLARRRRASLSSSASFFASDGIELPILLQAKHLEPGDSRVRRAACGSSSGHASAKSRSWLSLVSRYISGYLAVCNCCDRSPMRTKPALPMLWLGKRSTGDFMSYIEKSLGANERVVARSSFTGGIRSRLGRRSSFCSGASSASSFSCR